MVITAFRGVIVGFAVTLYVTDPLPEPEAPLVIVIQAAFSLVTHAQPLEAVTATVLVEAAGPSDATVGEIA